MYTDGGSLPESDTGQRVELQIKKSGEAPEAEQTGQEQRSRNMSATKKQPATSV